MSCFQWFYQTIISCKSLFYSFFAQNTTSHDFQDYFVDEEPIRNNFQQNNYVYYEPPSTVPKTPSKHHVSFNINVVDESQKEELFVTSSQTSDTSTNSILGHSHHIETADSILSNNSSSLYYSTFGAPHNELEASIYQDVEEETV